MKCGSCGSENRPGVKFCGTCGQALAANASQVTPAQHQSQMPYQPAQQAAPLVPLTSGKRKASLPRVMGSIAWFLVSIGTFIVAYWYFEAYDWSDPFISPGLGYATIVYAIAAIFFALSRLTRKD